MHTYLENKTFDLNHVLELLPFSLAKGEKAELYEDALQELTRHHYANCSEYRKILNVLRFDPNVKHSVEEMPFLPVRLFKNYELLSVPKTQIVRTLTSSGTSGQNVSRIVLDRGTAANQAKVLTKIISSFIGAKRLPMLIIDGRPAGKDAGQLSARRTGIFGFSMLGHDVTYALDESVQVDFDAVESFCLKHKDETILLFGFTFMVWEYFYKKLAASGRKLSLEKGILIHGGGWKKLTKEAVDNNTFKRSLEGVCGIQRVHNYYGMVEQTGSIFMECEAGYLHCSIFSDVMMRRSDFSVCNRGETGLVQLVSLLPWSYPGHSILSEDVGEIIGEDDCSCGRLGKYFKIHGRVKNAETRGCSDVFASN